MIPWKRQQIWFWLAAILIVAGASALRDTTHQTVDSNQVSKTSRRSMVVIRNRADLPPLIEIEKKSNADSGPEIQPGTLKEPVELVNFSESKEPMDEQAEIIYAEFSEPQLDNEESSSQVVQISFEQSEVDQTDHQAVWLSGTIEAVEDVPRIYSK